MADETSEKSEDVKSEESKDAIRAFESAPRTFCWTCGFDPCSGCYAGIELARKLAR